MQISSSITTVFGSIAASIFTLSSFPAPSVAAPQILAIASTDLPLPLLCERGECSAELTAFCLQEHRASPRTGKEYILHGDQKLQLSLKTVSGQEIDISSLPVKLHVARGHTAIRVSLKETLLRGMKTASLSVSVPAQMTAIPTPFPNDKNPQTQSDILLAASSLRTFASQVVDQNTNGANAARLITHAINTLPARGRAAPEQRQAAETYFTDVTQNSGYSDNAIELASKAVRQCKYETQVGYSSLRQCLGSSHDQLIGKLNTKYWKDLNSGS